MKMARSTLTMALICAASLWVDGALAQVPTALAAPGETVVATYHAEGAQVYECKAGNDGKLAWAFREPVATLLSCDRTVGRHYAGPTWELSDGSAVGGKAAASAPDATAGDIAWLKLDVVNRRGSGVLGEVTTVQRLNTHGGVLQGACDQAGSFRSVPYSADYSFLSKQDQDVTATIPKKQQ
jgi:hypothetical protein